MIVFFCCSFILFPISHQFLHEYEKHQPGAAGAFKEIISIPVDTVPLFEVDISLIICLYVRLPYQNCI